MRDPEFGIITPVAYLEKYASQSSFHLVLAHLVDSNEKYAAFYRKMAERGDFLILDNSAYELLEPYKPDKLIELGHKCKADAIVLPDYPFELGIKTIEASEKLIKPVKEAGFKTMFVPQSVKGNVSDWTATYMWARHHNDIDIIGMSILGIPNALSNLPKCYSRVVMAKTLLENGLFAEKKYHHWLGLQNASLEIPALLNLGVVDSLDSSNPVQAGICGHRYNLNSDSYLVPSKNNLPEVDFNAPFSENKQVHENIQFNIDVIHEMFSK